MSRRSPQFARIVEIVAVGWVLTTLSCGGGGQSNSATNSAMLAGNWQMTLTQTQPDGGPYDIKTESGFLTQSGTSVAGSVVLTGAALCPGLGTLQGTVDGSNVSITVNQIAQTVTLTGTATSSGASMSGNYSISASGCGNGSTQGTFTATQVKPLSGSFQAMFTSGEGWSPYSFATAITQGPNTGASNATISGTMTSTNAPCVQNLTVAGLVSGTSAVFNLLASDGSAVGQLRGTTSTDGTMLTGTYDFLAQTNGCYGDAGGVTIALQPSM